MRLFVAIRLSPAVKAALMDASGALRRQGSGIFTRAGNLHLTLAFIGETEDPAKARAALDAACGGGPFPLAVEGLGRFGDLVWAGVEESEPLRHLALAVQEALRERGFAIEERLWRPHVTLVRRWRGPRPQARVPRTEMEARRVSLMESARVDGGLVYREIAGWDL